MFRILETILESLGNVLCPLCGAELRYGTDLICVECLRRLIAEDRRTCMRCNQPAVGCRCGEENFTGTGLSETSPGRRFLSHTFYTGYSTDKNDLTVRLIYTAKQHRSCRLYRYIAGVLAADIRELFRQTDEDLTEWICTFPPRSAAGYRKYGFDQGEETARLLAEELGIPFRRMFVKRRGPEQKKAGNAEKRRENAEHSLMLRAGVRAEGCKILLFDDVITTGATILRAAELLSEAGAVCVFPVSYARTKHGVES